MGAYDNPTVAPMVNVGKIIGDNIQRIQQAEYLAREQKKRDKLLLESGAIDRTNAFENQSLDLRRKETSIDNMNEVASMMVDKYYENEKNYAGKRIDANEYRRIRQNLWNNLNQYQAFQKNTATTIVNYKKDKEEDLISQSVNGLQKQIRLEEFQKRSATIIAGDDGKARIKVQTPKGFDKDKNVIYEPFEATLEEYVNNPDLLSYDKKANLKTMTKTMVELAKANLHESSSYEAVKTPNMIRYFYNEDEAKKILTQDDDFNGFVAANLESIVEDYMPGDMIFKPQSTGEEYKKQLEAAKAWYAEHIYNQGLGREVGRQAAPRPPSSKLPQTTKQKVNQDIGPNADAIRKWDFDNEGLVDIDATLSLVGKTVFKNGKMFLRKTSVESLDEFKERLNIALGYVKPASKPSPK
jgi:hypothetical protein